MKSARQTSSRIGAINCEPLHTVLRDEDKCGVRGGGGGGGGGSTSLHFMLRTTADLPSTSRLRIDLANIQTDIPFVS